MKEEKRLALLEEANRIVEEALLTGDRPEKGDISAAMSAMSVAVDRTGDAALRQSWRGVRALQVAGTLIKGGLYGRTGRSTNKDEVLAWLDRKAAGGPITPAMKAAAEKKFGCKRRQINKWLCTISGLK